MKVNTHIITFIATISFLYSSSIMASSPVKLCQGSENEWPPYTIFKRANSTIVEPRQLTGAATELIYQAIKKAGYDYKIRLMPWKRVLKELERYPKRKVCEITWDVSYKPSRAEKFFYSVAIYRTQLGAFFSSKHLSEKALTLKNTTDLSQFRLCGILGYNYSPFNLHEGLFSNYINFDKAMNVLSAGNCDFLPSSIEPVLGQNKLGTINLSDNIDYVEFPGRFKTFYLVISRKSPRADELSSQLAHSIISMQEKGEDLAIFSQYGIKPKIY
ncbi:substrate-binding periplasmic protein [Zooshikella ganghwensis]|uniref:Solute-binding protein family 3/N-terminal domain-containing protein n=1 Tax=Zooshikella ganghwensis TaxID=202772 RepID=A0A4P9VK73_9GAMM|nr:transporter substrate-binding domain-containing protein [Zooshikella ganghwensis]RDH43653.1 hypothetical protein B9G39_09480 [Zooshikella ganghwensis]